MPDIDVFRSNGVATLTLNRPGKLNALSPALLEELIEICAALTEDEHTRVVVLCGAGANFSAGADLPGFNAAFATGGSAERVATADLGRRATEAVWRLPQITVAAIHGHCVGGALVLAACCDLRIASDATRFSIPEVDAGIPLAWGGMGHLNRLIGETLTVDLVLSCRPFSAHEALDAGLLTQVVTANALDTTVQERAASTAKKAHSVLRLIKAQLTALRDKKFHPENDAEALLAARNDEEAQAIGQTYVEKLVNKSRRRP